MSLDILVGCPVKDRAWILPEWHQRVKDSVGGYNVEFLFIGEEGDDETLSMAESFGKLVVLEDKGFKDNHNWGNKKRIEYMKDLRNVLLENVRESDPDLFLSLDSDILIPKPLIGLLRNTINNKDVEVNAVGGFTYMDQMDPNVTSFGMKKSGKGFIRVKNPGVHKVDYIMAIKLMDRKAYNVDYKFSPHGEDIGWCDSARENGLTLFCDGRLASKHVINKEMISLVDKRVGF